MTDIDESEILEDIEEMPKPKLIKSKIQFVLSPTQIYEMSQYSLSPYQIYEMHRFQYLLL